MTLLMRDNEKRAEGRAEGLAEGRAEGLTEGRAEGLTEGRAEGKAEIRKEFLFRITEAIKQGQISLDTGAKILGVSIEEMEQALADYA